MTGGNISGTLSANPIQFNYMMEQPLTVPIYFPPAPKVFGYVDNPTSSNFEPITCYVLDLNTVLSASLISPDADYISKGETEYYNPFKLKNMYNYNWNMEITRPDTLYGVRSYFKVGTCADKLWMSYKYYREIPTIVQEFENAERVAGLYKLVPYEGHKSNIYSLRVFNSGLNESISDITIRSDIQNIVEKSFIKAVKKMGMSSTQLWYIDWLGL